MIKNIIKKTILKIYSLNASINRETYAKKYISGDGIEIGALHNPLVVGKKANIKYVDRMSNKDLLTQYKEMNNENLVSVDIVDDGETLKTILDNSQDFVIANHFIEHCKNPILTFNNLFRVLKTDGILYCAIPDKRFTFDKNRSITTIEHLSKDYENNNISHNEHYLEWVKFSEKIEDDGKANKRSEYLISTDYSIHFHVWDNDNFLKFLIYLKNSINFQIELYTQNGGEILAIMKKL